MVGIGKGVSTKELDHMAGGDGKAFLAQTFDQLISEPFVAKLTQVTCKAGTLTLADQ